MTLLEVAIASAILAVVTSIVFLILQRSGDSYANESAHLALDERARDTLDQIARDLREAGLDTLRGGDPPALIIQGQVYTDLRFGALTGYDLGGRQLQFGRLIRYRWRPVIDEVENKLDDNGNGLVDEGYVERTDPSGAVFRICGDVRVRGLQFVVRDRSVTVTLELERRDAKGTTVRLRAETVVELRNAS